MALDLRMLIQARDEASRTLKNVGTATGGLFSKFASLKNLLVGGLGFGALAFGLKKVFAASTAQEEAEAALTAALKSTGGAAGLTFEELTKLASELQEVTTFGDEATIQAEAMLLTFTKIGKDVFPDTLKIVQDLSVGMGTDMKNSAIMVGKALNDPILGVTALRRVGVQLSKTQEEQIKKFVELGEVAKAQKIILQELNVQFGGRAQAQAQTFGGQLTRMGLVMGDFVEKIGDFLGKSGPFQSAVGFITDAFTKLNKAVEKLRETQKKLTEKVMVDMKKEMEEIMQRATVTKIGFMDMADAVTFATEEDRKRYEFLKVYVDKYKELNKVIKNNTNNTNENTDAGDEQTKYLAAVNKWYADARMAQTKRMEEAEAQQFTSRQKNAEFERQQEDEYIMALASNAEEALTIRRELLRDTLNNAILSKEERVKIEKEWYGIIDQQADLSKNKYKELASVMATSLGTTIGGLITGTRDLGDVMKQTLSTGIMLIAKLALAGVPGGGLISGLLGGLIGGFQTIPGQRRVVPGSPFQAMPALVHGGETISRGGGTVNITFSGPTFNADETMEVIRGGLMDLRLTTGRSV